MFDVITIGSATRDVFLVNTPFYLQKSKKSPTDVFACLPLGSKIEMKELLFETGGGATNTAATFANLGLRTGTFARIGNDPSGREIISNLRDAGVNTNLLYVDTKQRTGYSVILLAPAGERTVLVYRGASRTLKAKEFPWSKIKTKWFYISSLAGNVSLLKKLVDFAHKNNIKAAVNPGSLELKAGLKKLKPIFNKIDILILNREEASGLVKKPFSDIKKIAEAMRRQFRVLTNITDGKRGACVLDENKIVYAKTFNVKIVNTTGAGDAFGSAFTAGMALKNDPDFALRLAILNSNKVIQEMGAKRGLLAKIPSNKELAKVKIKKLSNKNF